MKQYCSMNVKSKIIPIAEPLLGKEELHAVLTAVKSGWVSSKGAFICEFEKRFSAYCCRKYGIVTSNGTAALHLALTALGIGHGDEVIVPTLTFIATANAVRYTGAKPVFVDSESFSWGMDPRKVEAVITKRTKAIIPVHLYGYPCMIDEILKIARKHKLHIVEDAAEAHGAEYKGKKIGSFGSISCFSFYANKVITTGEGGICLTDDYKLAQRMRILRDHGMNLKKKYWFDMIGFNYRMTNMQAALGVAQLRRIGDFIRKKQEIKQVYNDLLQPLCRKGAIALHPELPLAKCVFWMYCILIEKKFGITRNKVMEKLNKAGIETRPLFYPIHTMKPYKTNGDFSIAEELAHKGINLPSSTTLTVSKIRYIAKVLKSLVK